MYFKDCIHNPSVTPLINRCEKADTGNMQEIVIMQALFHNINHNQFSLKFLFLWHRMRQINSLTSKEQNKVHY